MRPSVSEVLALHHGDARDAGRLLSDAAAYLSPEDPEVPFLTATITSPPYANLINYRVSEQIGFGQSWDEYLFDCETLFADVYRWTREDGCFWLVADTFLEPGPAAKTSSDRRPSGVRLLPFELANIAQRVGWTLREVIIWHKDRTLPWSGRGRMRNSFEYVLFMVKSDHFQYHVDRLRDQSVLSRWWVRYPERYNPLGISPDNVWSIPIPVQGSWGKSTIRHACPFPTELVRRMLLLSTEPNDVVFDPFAGSGTVLAVAEAMGRRAIGTELNAEYVKAYYDILRSDVLQRWQSLEDGDQEDISATLLELRAVKYPKVLLNRFKDNHPEMTMPTLAGMIVETPRQDYLSGSALAATLIFVIPGATDGEREDVTRKMKALCQKPPLSKFSIAADICVVSAEEFIRLVGDSVLYVYQHGHTWMSTGSVSGNDALLIPPSVKPGRHTPIVSNVNLKIRFPEND